MQTLKAKLKFGSAPNGAENGIGIQAGTVGCALLLPLRRGSIVFDGFEPFSFVASLGFLRAYWSTNSMMSDLKDFNSDAEGTNWLAHPASCD